MRGLGAEEVRDDWVLGLFAKWPRPGHVKSRLAADTSPAWAARVAEAFLHDTVGRLSRLPVRRILVHDPPEAGDEFARLAARRFELTPQAAGGLGERLLAFVRDQFAAGARRLVLVGADSPTLPPALVEQAYHSLEKKDVVLGPATDGGYYLIGCRAVIPRLFTGIAWSGPQVLADTVAAVEEAGQSLELLQPWYDVDTLADWWMLCGHLRALRAAGLDPETPHTEKLRMKDEG